MPEWEVVFDKANPVATIVRYRGIPIGHVVCALVGAERTSEGKVIRTMTLTFENPDVVVRTHDEDHDEGQVTGP